MQPTNKLRWKKFDSYYEEKFSPAAHKIEGTGIYFVLQQWWEEQRNEITPPPGIQPIFRSPPRGEWRDIPIEVEE